jgi:hypothetical protein
VRFAGFIATIAVCILAIAAAVLIGGVGFIVVAAVFGALALVGVYDVAQRRHSILRNYPILGHARFMLEAIRPELQQYFIERNTDGRPYDRDTRTSIYRLRVAAAVDPLLRPAGGPSDGDHRGSGLHQAL